MAMIDKQILVKEVEKALYDKLTAKDINTVATALMNRLAVYELKRTEESKTAGDSEELLSGFLDAKRLSGCSEKTLTRYRYVIGRMLESVKVPIREITVYHLRGYLMDEKKRGIKDSTLNGNRQVYNSMFSWLKREGMIPINPCANLETIRKKREMRKPFSDVEIERLKEACTRLRDKAIITFLLSTGCRISEACDLNVEDIDLQNMECTVLGKGNKERKVYLNPVAELHLEDYLDERGKKEGPLFTGKGSERLQPGGVRTMLKKVAERAGVENVHPHRFRRTLATNLIKRGMTIQEVARVLGHEKIDTTMRYIYLDDRDVKNNHMKYA